MPMEAILKCMDKPVALLYEPEAVRGRMCANRIAMPSVALPLSSGRVWNENNMVVFMLCMNRKSCLKCYDDQEANK